MSETRASVMLALVGASSSIPSRRFLRLFSVLLGFCLLSPIGRSALDDDRIGQLREEVQTLEGVVNATKNTGEKSRLQGKLERLRQELNILVEQQAIDARQRALADNRNASTIDTLREKLRAIDHTVDEVEGRIRGLLEHRKQITAERDALLAQSEAVRAKGDRNADRIADLDEKLFTKNEELRTFALEREAAEGEIELIKEADVLRENIKSYNPNARATLRSLFESYTRLRDEKKTVDQLGAQEANLQQNLKISQASYELAQQKLAKFDEELAVLEKQTGFFSTDARIERLLAVQRSQKQAVSERMPIIAAQIDAIKRAQLALHNRQELAGLQGALQQEQFRALQDRYVQRLRWPAVALSALLLMHLLARYALLPLIYKNEDLFLSRRLSRYVLIIAAVCVMAGFLFDDLSMVAATLGVVSAALVISLQDVCTSVFGWFVIMLGGKFGIGDRLEIDGTRGDVIDIQLLRTTLLEVNGWLGVDQPTGRVIVVPNNFIFKTKVFNFSHGHPYIWGKIDLTVTFATPVASAMALFQRVLEEETREEFAAAQTAATSIRRRYGVEDAVYQPKIYTNIADSGVTFSLFFVANYRGFSAVRNRVNRRLIAELETHRHIQLAYHTLQILRDGDVSNAPSAVLGEALTTPPFVTRSSGPSQNGKIS